MHSYVRTRLESMLGAYATQAQKNQVLVQNSGSGRENVWHVLKFSLKTRFLQLSRAKKGEKTIP